MRSLVRRALGSLKRQAPRRFVWNTADAAGMAIGLDGKPVYGSATIPYLNLRAYIERQQIRAILQQIVERPGTGKAAEIGCGFGRVTMVLSEWFAVVHGFEREGHLVEIARTLQPDIIFHQVESLARLGLGDSELDFAMTFTVCQHMKDSDTRAVLEEMKRIVSEGHVLLIEKTDPSAVFGDPADGSQFLSIGRAVDTFERWMAPFRLVRTFPRRVEPTYPNAANVGTYMLFAYP